MPLNECVRQGLAGLAVSIPLAASAAYIPGKVLAILDSSLDNPVLSEECREQGEWLAKKLEEQGLIEGNRQKNRTPVSYSAKVFPNGITNNGYVYNSEMLFKDGSKANSGPQLINIVFPLRVKEFQMNWKGDDIQYQIHCQKNSAAND